MASHKGSVLRGSKKGGCGGKFTWGKAGELVELEPLQPGDPMYDPEIDGDDSRVIQQDHASQASKVAKRLGIDTKAHKSGFAEISTAPGNTPGNRLYLAGSPVIDTFDATKHNMNLREFKRKVEQALLEFFESSDLTELYSALMELDMPFFRYEVVRKAITLSLDRGDREREMISQMISEFYGNLFSMEQIGKGFERLLEFAEDIAIDVPDAEKFITKFLARAVADEVLPPAFLSDPLVEQIGGNIIQQSKTLLSIKHGAARLEKIWGVSALSSVGELKEAISMLLEEYFDTEDVSEATRCVKTMQVQHFHHELVKRAVVLGIEKNKHALDLVMKLFKHLNSETLLSETQLTKGLNRVYASLEDMKLDTPDASVAFEKLIGSLRDYKLLPEDYFPEATASPSTVNGEATPM